VNKYHFFPQYRRPTSHDRVVNSVYRSPCHKWKMAGVTAPPLTGFLNGLTEKCTRMLYVKLSKYE
jgi:hypothetical protein